MNKTTFGILAIVGTAATAQAAHLITIDLSVVNQVTLTATTNASAATASGSVVTGIYFDNLYGASGDALSATLVGGDITSFENPSDSSPSLFRAGSGADTGLNMWSFSTDSTATFTAGGQAFTGSGTWDLDANEYADMLAGNSSGDIYFPADDAGDVAGATLIGTYEVFVPAPGAAGVLALGGLVAMRRRR